MGALRTEPWGGPEAAHLPQDGDGGGPDLPLPLHGHWRRGLS